MSPHASTDHVDVSAADTYVETGKITEASLDLLKDVTGAFIDEQGNLLDGYSFVGVKLNIRSEKELKINTASFVLRGISKDEYFDASCFYQDGERTGTDDTAFQPVDIRHVFPGADAGSDDGNILSF